MIVADTTGMSSSSINQMHYRFFLLAKKVEDDNERMQHANLAAQAAERRLSANKSSINVRAVDVPKNNHFVFISG